RACSIIRNACTGLRSIRALASVRRRACCGGFSKRAANAPLETPPDLRRQVVGRAELLPGAARRPEILAVTEPYFLEPPPPVQLHPDHRGLPCGVRVSQGAADVAGGQSILARKAVVIGKPGQQALPKYRRRFQIGL